MHLINNVSRQGVGGRGRKLKVTLKMIYDVCFAKRRYGGSGGLSPGQKIETGIQGPFMFLRKCLLKC